MNSNKDIIQDFADDLKDKNEKACWIDAENCPYSFPQGRLDRASAEWCVQCVKIKKCLNLQSIIEDNLEDTMNDFKNELCDEIDANINAFSKKIKEIKR